MGAGFAPSQRAKARINQEPPQTYQQTIPLGENDGHLPRKRVNNSHKPDRSVCAYTRGRKPAAFCNGIHFFGQSKGVTNVPIGTRAISANSLSSKDRCN
jgi:hypothetical protein